MSSTFYVFSGYAAVFNNTDDDGDVLLPGCFKQSLNDYPAPAVRMLWQHDTSQPIGVWEHLAEDARGLKVRGRLPNNVQRAREAAELIRIGGLNGLSIGYRPVKTRAGMVGRRKVRMIKALTLLEISPVTFPMNPLARVS